MRYLLKLVQISRRLELPEARDIVGQFPGFGRLPVLNEASFVGGNNRVVPLVVLKEN